MVPSAQRCAVMVGAASAGVVALPGHLCGPMRLNNAFTLQSQFDCREARAFPHFKLPAVGRRALTIWVPRIIRRGGGAEEPTSAKASGGSSAGLCQKGCPHTP